MSNILLGLKIAIAVLLLCIVISMGFSIYTRSKDQYDKGTSELIDITSGVGIEDLLQYDGSSISGALAVTFAEKYRTMFPIVFVTGEVPTGFYDISFVRETTNAQYVNPNKQFRLNIDRNNSGDPIALVFIQSGCSKPAYDIDKAAAYMYKSQLVFKKLIAEQRFQESLAIYTDSIDRYSSANFKVLTKKSDQQSENYWMSQSETQKQLYEENSNGLR